jgi:hypothetical protein
LSSLSDKMWVIWCLKWSSRSAGSEVSTVVLLEIQFLRALHSGDWKMIACNPTNIGNYVC